MSVYDFSSDRALNKWLGGVGPGRIVGTSGVGPDIGVNEWSPNEVRIEQKISGDATQPPARHGQAYTTEELEWIRSKFFVGYTPTKIARALQRKTSALLGQLEKMRLMRRVGEGYGPTDYVRVSGVFFEDLPALIPPAAQTAPYPQAKKGNIVNFNHLVTLLQQNYTTLTVAFDGAQKGSPNHGYTYKVSNEIAATLKKDDFVVAPARDTFMVVKVLEIHEEPQIDPDTPYALKWVVQKVDMAPYADQIHREEEAVRLLQQAKRKKAQEEALEAILGSVSREELLALLNPKKD
jgi:hypothetical protein